MTSSPKALRTVKLVHTIAWAFFAGCIVAIPLCVALGRRQAAALCSAIVAGEVLILLANRWRCPLTAVAARYTADRRHNFDIYLPEWLAHYNKLIFGALYVAGLALLAWSWFTGAGRGG